jgi:hypothetical protein
MIVFRSRPLFVALILAIGLGILPGRAVAQVATTSDADLMNASWACLVLKFRRHVGNQGDPGHPGAVEPDRLGPTEGYDPNSGRNFAWDSEQKAWIDAKTGERICPKSQPSEADLRDTFWCCMVLKLRRHVGNTHDPGHPGLVEPQRSGPTEGYDPNSGRNFAWDSEQKAWIDAKTGECICPKCPPKTAASAPASAQSGQAAQPPPETGSSVPGFGFGLGVGGFGRGQDRSKDSDRRP